MKLPARFPVAGALSAMAVLLFCCSSLQAMERDVVISVYQGPCANGDFAANLATVREQVREAAARNSDFIVFPETFLSGYDSPENVRRGARRLDDPELAAFVRESAAHGMVVIVGLAMLDNQDGIHNTALVIHNGKILGTYDKSMLTGGDRDRLKFVAGKEVPVFEAKGARFAVIICHDTSFPHPAMIAKLKGAEILFTPHYNYINARTVDAHRKVVRNSHIGLACLLKLIVARSNVVVTDRPGSVGYGHSFIMSPQGEMLAESELFRQEMLTATVGPGMFKIPYVWADLEEVPRWMRQNLADLLVEEGKE